MPKYKVPEDVTHIVIAGRAYEPEEGILTIDDGHAAAVAAAAGNGFPVLVENDRKTGKPVKKSS
jgi:hypothetical protein